MINRDRGRRISGLTAFEGREKEGVFEYETEKLLACTVVEANNLCS